jgi:hypothetical protein
VRLIETALLIAIADSEVESASVALRLTDKMRVALSLVTGKSVAE